MDYCNVTANKKLTQLSLSTYSETNLLLLDYFRTHGLKEAYEAFIRETGLSEGM